MRRSYCFVRQHAKHVNFPLLATDFSDEAEMVASDVEDAHRIAAGDSRHIRATSYIFRYFRMSSYVPPWLE